MLVRVRVSQSLIDQGVRRDPLTCPVATAIGEVYPPGVVVRISYYACCRLGDRYRVFTLPERAWHFIQRFDLGLPVKPFKFEIPPWEV